MTLKQVDIVYEAKKSFKRRIRDSIRLLNDVVIPQNSEKPFAGTVFLCARVMANMGASSTWICRNSRKRVIKVAVPDTTVASTVVNLTQMHVVDLTQPDVVDLTQPETSAQRPVSRRLDTEGISCSTFEEELPSDSEEVDDRSHAQASRVRVHAHKRQREPDENYGCEVETSTQRPVSRRLDTEGISCSTFEEELPSDSEEVDDRSHAQASRVRVHAHKRQRQPSEKETLRRLIHELNGDVKMATRCISDRRTLKYIMDHNLRWTRTEDRALLVV